jgi:hypothetical protein
MAGSLGADASKRIFPIADGGHNGCLNFSETSHGSFVADVMHLDGRDVLPTWLHPKSPQPVADVIPKELAEGEASLGEPAYILVRGNHVAVIERMGFRNGNMQRYINALLKEAGELDPGTEWSLDQRIELEGGGALSGSVRKLTFRPHAALVGAIQEPGGALAADGQPKERRVTRRMSDLIAHGQRVLDMVRAAGADEAKLESLRNNMSNDLTLQARLEIFVSSVHRKTEAEVSADLIQKAFAELTSEGDVSLVTSDGRTDGKLVQLSHTAEVQETGGLIDWQRATYALIAALNAWAAKGSIDLNP